LQWVSSRLGSEFAGKAPAVRLAGRSLMKARRSSSRINVRPPNFIARSRPSRMALKMLVRPMPVRHTASEIEMVSAEESKFCSIGITRTLADPDGLQSAAGLRNDGLRGQNDKTCHPFVIARLFANNIPNGTLERLFRRVDYHRHPGRGNELRELAVRCRGRPRPS
jgi:hypothetical protein